MDMGYDKRFGKFNYSIFLIALVICSYSLIISCVPRSGGLGKGIYTDAGVYCLRAATLYEPVLGSFEDAPPTQPAIPLTEQECAKSMTEIPMQWEFQRTDIPNSAPLVANTWDVIDAVEISGKHTCIFKVYVPSQDVIDKGFGTWQVKHKVGDWSVRCSELIITECPTNNNAVNNYWTSHTTINKSECIQEEIGVNIAEPTFP